VLEANRTSPSFLTAAIRPAGIFGEYDNQALYRMQLIRGAKTRFQIGPNDNLFDYTHVTNIAYSHLIAAEALLQTNALGVTPLDSEKVDGEAFFITNGEPVYFWDFIRRVWHERGLPEDKAYNVKKVFVLNAGVALILASILEFVMGIFGKSPNFTHNAVRASIMTRYYNIDKARRRLKYEPIISLEDGIKRGVKEVAARQAREEESKKKA
jgi:sterol-4alpha-carboxylate 3-dehydrogenase (decarboxylating)